MKKQFNISLFTVSISSTFELNSVQEEYIKKQIKAYIEMGDQEGVIDFGFIGCVQWKITKIF